MPVLLLFQDGSGRPNSSGRNLGHTLSRVTITEQARRVPISQDSARVFPYVRPIVTPAKKASPAPVVSSTSTFVEQQIPLFPPMGRILRSYGLKVSAIKIDPYLNWDSGTLNPV